MSLQAVTRECHTCLAHLAWVFLLCWMSISPAVAIDPPTVTPARRDAMVRIVEKVKAAVINIHSERTIGPTLDDPFRPSGVLKPQRQRGMGTGIVLDPRGYIVTNFHVVSEIESLRVALHDGRNLSARVIATDKKADLAMIKIDPPTPLITVPLGTAGDLFDAEQVIAIGNAYGYEHTVSIGNVAYKSRDVELNKEISYHGLIQTTAPINPGNSGGPLFNKKGELIGVNVAIRAGAQNIAFAIPVDSMIDRAADMLSVRNRMGMKHGISVKDRCDRPGDESMVHRWVEVVGVELDSPATLAEVKVGDVIEQVGDLPVITSIDVERAFLDRPLGAKVPLVLRRGKDKVSTSISLQPIEKSSSNAELIVQRMGMRLSPVNREIVAKIDSQLRGGLLITDMSVNGPAFKSGLQRGDILLGFQMSEPLEAINLDNVLFVLNHRDLAKYMPLKTFFVRDGRLRETFLAPLD